MFTFSSTFRDWGVGAKITFFTFALTSIILAALLTMISYTTASMLEQRAAENTANDLVSVSTTIEIFNRVVASEATSFSHVLAAAFEGKFSIDNAALVDVAGKQVPTLKTGMRR
jgi:methyl-accepting chemotaxis protein